MKSFGAPDREKVAGGSDSFWEKARGGRGRRGTRSKRERGQGQGRPRPCRENTTTSINGGIINRSSRASVKRLRARGEGNTRHDVRQREGWGGFPISGDACEKEKGRKKRWNYVNILQTTITTLAGTNSSVLDCVRRHLKQTATVFAAVLHARYVVHDQARAWLNVWIANARNF